MAGRESLTTQVNTKTTELEELKSKLYEENRKNILLEELQNRLRIMTEDVARYDSLLRERSDELEKMRQGFEEFSGIKQELNENETAVQNMENIIDQLKQE